MSEIDKSNEDVSAQGEGVATPEDSGKGMKGMSQKRLNELLQKGDEFISDYLGKYLPALDQDDVDVELIVSQIVTEIDALEADEGAMIIAVHPFMKKLSELGRSKNKVSCQDIVIQAVKSGIPLPEKLDTREVREFIEEDKEIGLAVNSVASGNKVGVSGDVSPQSQGRSDARIEGAVKNRFEKNPEILKKLKDKLSKERGYAVSDEECVSHAVETIKASGHTKDHQHGSGEQMPVDSPIPQSSGSALVNGLGRALKSIPKGAMDAIKKGKQSADMAMLKSSAKEITSGKARAQMKEFDSHMSDLSASVETLKSNMTADGEKLKPTDRKKLQNDVLASLSKCGESMVKMSKLADDEFLPKKDRLEMYKKSEMMESMAEDLSSIPLGKGKSDEDFKQKLNDSIKSISEIAKSIMEAITSFFRSKAKSLDVDQEPGLSP